MLAVLAFVAAASMGADSDARDIAMSPIGAVDASTVTLAAMPYARTVSCGTYTLTGTYTGASPTGWTASPSGASGSCTDLGAGSFSCAVDVDPDATGEGVETITVGTETATIGFYVDGEHSCFLAQSVDGSYNSTLADLDAVSTWENLGSSGLDVTQPGAATLKPTFRTAIVGGQPVVRCDGGDGVVAATASDWAFLNDSADYSLSWVAATSSSNPNALQVVATTRNVDGASASRGLSSSFDDRAAIPTNDRANLDIRNGTGVVCTIAGTADSVPSAKFNDVLNVHDDDGGAGVDFTMFANGSSVGTCSGSPTYSSSAPASPLRLCQNFTSAGFNLTGDLFRVLIYQSALTATQRGINKAVDEWALGGTLPVTPPLARLDSSDTSGITTAGGAVSSWRSSGIVTASATQGTGASQPTSSTSPAFVDFDGSNDFVTTSSVSQTSASTFHYILVATVDDASTSVACGGSTWLNNGAITTNGAYSGIMFQKTGGTVYAQAYNYDTGADCVETAITTGGKVIIEARLTGGQLGLAINGGAFSETASGNTGALGFFAFGGYDGTAGRQMDGKIHEVAVYAAALPSGERTTTINDLKTKWGIP